MQNLNSTYYRIAIRLGGSYIRFDFDEITEAMHFIVTILLHLEDSNVPNIVMYVKQKGSEQLNDIMERIDNE